MVVFLAYQHPVAKGIELMIAEALRLANPHFTIRGSDGRRLTMSEAVWDMEAFCKLNDSVHHLVSIPTALN